MPANTGLACPPQLKSINTVRVFFVYIPKKKVTESIHWLCLKSIPLAHVFSPTS